MWPGSNRGSSFEAFLSPGRIIAEGGGGARRGARPVSGIRPCVAQWGRLYCLRDLEFMPLTTELRGDPPGGWRLTVGGRD